MIMQGKHVFIGASEVLNQITKFVNRKYLIPFHLSEQKAFLSFQTIAMRKSLPERITDQINRM